MAGLFNSRQQALRSVGTAFTNATADIRYAGEWSTSAALIRDAERVRERGGAPPSTAPPGASLPRTPLPSRPCLGCGCMRLCRHEINREIRDALFDRCLHGGADLAWAACQPPRRGVWWPRLDADATACCCCERPNRCHRPRGWRSCSNMPRLWMQPIW